jgi:hypothetical protein
LPTSLPSFSDKSHLCCNILAHKSEAVSGSNFTPLISNILLVQSLGEKSSGTFSFIKNLLLGLLRPTISGIISLMVVFKLVRFRQSQGSYGLLAPVQKAAKMVGWKVGQGGL